MIPEVDELSVWNCCLASQMHVSIFPVVGIQDGLLLSNVELHPFLKMQPSLFLSGGQALVTWDSSGKGK